MARTHLVTLTGLAFALALPTVASAQYAPPPPPPGYGAPAPAGPPVVIAQPAPERKGLTLGFSIGAGGMESSDGPIECADCEDSVSGSFDFHIGLMLSPKMAILFESWGTAQALDAAGDATLVQILNVGALQYWVTPRVWLKGGVGAAHLAQSYSDNTSDEIDNGVAAVGAIGVELIHRPRFALDVQLRGGTGTYEGIDDKIHQGSLQLGFSWF